MSVFPITPTRTALARYVACLRLEEILVLQGSPLLGAAFALHHPTKFVAAFAVLALANLCMVAHIFTINDWSGLSTDLSDPNKASRVFTARGVGRREIGVLAAGLLAISLALFSRLGAGTFCLALAIVALSALYSLPRFHWKGQP